MVHMLALTCRHSLSFLFISATTSHYMVHHLFYSNISIIQESAESICASVYVSLHFACMCVYCCVGEPVWGKMRYACGRKWIVRVRWGYIPILGRALSVKNSFDSWTYFSPCIRNRLGPHLAPVRENTMCCKIMPPITALSLSPWTWIFFRISNNWQRAGNIKRHTALWACSRWEWRISDQKDASVNPWTS